MNQQEIQIKPIPPRREYFKNYHLKRKEEEAKKTKGVSNVLQLFSKKKKRSSNQPSGWEKCRRNAEIALLMFLAATMTIYLISEAAKFYLDSQEVPVMAYFKAGIVEGIAILFSFGRGKGIVIRWAQRVVVVLLCTLTLWTLSDHLIRGASEGITQSQTSTDDVATLEVELRQKEALQSQYVANDWLREARKHEKGVDALRARLASARQAKAALRAPVVILNSLGILLAFRLLLVIANLICFHRLSEQFNQEVVPRLSISVQQIG